MINTRRDMISLLKNTRTYFKKRNNYLIFKGIGAMADSFFVIYKQMNRSLLKTLIAEILFGNALCESIEDRHFVGVVYKTINGDALNEKLLVGEPVSIAELRNLLHKRILNFEFIKINGEIRPARGTTMMKYIPQSDHPKGIRPSSPKVATFFDLDKKAWRSVSKKSKEVVMKYGFGEKKKPVFVVKDKDQEVPDLDAKDMKYIEPSGEEVEKDDVEDVTPAKVDGVDKEGIEDVTPVEKDFLDKEDIEDVTPISKPNVDVIEKKPRYGWKPKGYGEPKSEDLPASSSDIEDIIVKPNIGWRPKVYKDPSPPVKVLLPRPVGKPLEPASQPGTTPMNTTGPKPPPLSIEPEEYMGF
ncbi:MAG: DUF2693 domain-containing protein [Chloroflexia bacterium]|nr:DUF2693 domain-containing protein [Chloroflexia bacterium]